jgi:hypothetical protein
MQRDNRREERHAVALILVLIIIGFVLLYSIHRDTTTGNISINPVIIMLGFFLAVVVYFTLTFPFHVLTFPTQKERIPLQIRFCVACGRNIPFDSIICPYCRYDYEKNIEK